MAIPTDISCESKDYMTYEMETVDMDGVPIFSTGIWEGSGSAEGGDHITEEVLDSWVETFNKVGAKVKPRLTLGHDRGKSESITGMAALGWIQNLRRQGKELVADIKSIPKKIASLIDKKAIGRFSPGLFGRMNINGEDYFNVLDHVAILGSQLPANMDLDGFIDLYEYENTYDSYELKLYEYLREDSMDEKVKELEGKLREYASNIENKDSKIDELSSRIEALEKTISEKDKVIQDAEFAAREKEITMYLEGQVEKGIITPAQSDMYKKLSLGQTNEDGGDVKEFTSRFDVVKNIIESADKVPTTEESVASDKQFEKEEPKDETKKTMHEEEHAKALEYMEKHNLEDNYKNYNRALLAVSEGGK